MPNLKDRAVIVLAGSLDLNLSDYINDTDYIIAVDGGYDHLLCASLKPDITIGDFDSVNNLIDGSILKFDSVKDDTDFKCALDYASNTLGFKQICVFGFTSLNRIDHVLSNISNITANCTFISANQQISLLEGTSKVKRDEYKYLSFYSLEIVDKFTLVGFKYPLTNYQLRPFDPLCISNELTDDSGTIEISNGRVVMIKSILN